MLNRITPTEISLNNVKSVVGNRLTGTVQENKNVFDKLGELIAEKLNAVIDTLNSSVDGNSGADNVMLTTIDGVIGTTVQTVLESIASSLNEVYQSADVDKLLFAKADKTVVSALVKSIDFNEDTGTFTITKENGTQTEIDTLLEKVITNFTYDNVSQSLVLTDSAGNKQSISLSAFITETEFTDTDTIAFSVVGGNVKADIKDGSISANKLDGNIVTTITNAANSASTSETNAKASEVNAAQYAANAKLSEDNARASEVNAKTSEKNAKTSEDNAKKYAEQAQTASGITVDTSLSTVSINPVQNKVITTELNKKVNVEAGKGLFSGSYNDLTEKPIIDNAISSTSTNAVQNKVVYAELGKKVNAETGKGLSTKDYTAADKNKLNGITPMATKNTITDYTATILAGGGNWTTGGVQTISVPGIIASDTPIVDVDMSTYNAEVSSAFSTIYKMETVDNQIKVYVIDGNNLPTVDIPIKLKVVR